MHFYKKFTNSIWTQLKNFSKIFQHCPLISKVQTTTNYCGNESTWWCPKGINYLLVTAGLCRFLWRLFFFSFFYRQQCLIWFSSRWYGRFLLPFWPFCHWIGNAWMGSFGDDHFFDFGHHCHSHWQHFSHHQERSFFYLFSQSLFKK